MLFIAGMMVLALFVPAAMAASYPQNGQFIAQYDEDKLAKDTSSENGGTTYYAGEATKAAASLVSVATTRSLDQYDWPQFMYDEANMGYSPCSNLPDDNTSVVVFDDREVIGTVNPIVADGKIFLYTGYAGFDEPSGLTEINLTCIDESNMTVDWDFPLPRTQHLGSWGAPATDGTYVYAASDNKIYKIRISDCYEMWNFTTIENAMCNGGLTVTDDYVFGSDWYGDYYCLFKDNGSQKWVFNNSDTRNYDMTYSQSTPAYDPDEGTAGMMYVCGWGYDSNTTYSGFLYKVNVATGREVWSKGVGTGYSESFCGSPSTDGTNVYVASYSLSSDGNLYAYEIDGTYINKTPIERTDATPSLDTENGLVYVSGGWNGGSWGSADPGLRCFQMDEYLTPVWDRENEEMGGWTCLVAIGDGYVFVGKESSDMNSFCYNTTYALNASTGATEWFYPAGGATAAIANDKVYTAGNDGFLYIFS
ncbi:PQQ-binding-like beta-propeller repeat protein [Methanolacinia petrolearia]|uniref:PQQ-binding-like beta-propeller repeat protein n=1 Tax=Methanolacinia petrolearia TaxID=54120 RepID=UPI003BA98C6E